MHKPIYLAFIWYLPFRCTWPLDGELELDNIMGNVIKSNEFRCWVFFPAVSSYRPGYPEGSGEAWRGYSQTKRARYNSMAGHNPWTDTGATFAGVPLRPRFIDCINVAWLHRLWLGRKHVAQRKKALTKQELARDFICNPSQTVDNEPWLKGAPSEGNLTALTTTALLYSYSADACLECKEHCAIQGFPSDIDLSMLDEAEGKTISGNSFAIPPLAACFYSIFCDERASWWQ